jgi:hypothetical protein
MTAVSPRNSYLRWLLRVVLVFAVLPVVAAASLRQSASTPAQLHLSTPTTCRPTLRHGERQWRMRMPSWAPPLSSG